MQKIYLQDEDTDMGGEKTTPADEEE